MVDLKIIEERIAKGEPVFIKFLDDIFAMNTSSKKTWIREPGEFPRMIDQHSKTFTDAILGGKIIDMKPEEFMTKLEDLRFH